MGDKKTQGDKIPRKGRTTENEMQVTAILGTVFRDDEMDRIREDYFRTMRQLRGEEE